MVSGPSPSHLLFYQFFYVPSWLPWFLGGVSSLFMRFLPKTINVPQPFLIPKSFGFRVPGLGWC